jgi:hypothetical protein
LTTLCLSGAEPSLFALDVSCTLIHFHFAPSWELEAPFGSRQGQYKLLTWMRFKNLITPSTVWGHLRTVDQDSVFPLCYPTHLMNTSHSLQYPDHHDITWSPQWHFLSWFVYKTYVVASVPAFRTLLPASSRNSGVWVHLQIQKVVTINRISGLPQPGSRMHLPWEGPGVPLPEQNVKSWTKPPNCWN